MLRLRRQVRKSKKRVSRATANLRTETTSMKVQTEPFLHLFESQELFFIAKIQKLQATESCLQRGSISLDSHWEGVRGIREQPMRVVIDYMTQMEK